MTVELSSWRGVTLPPPHTLRDGEIWGVDNEGCPIRISFSPCVVQALSRNAESETWHMNLLFLDRDGREHTRTVPAGDVFCSPSSVVRLIVDQGFSLAPGRTAALGRYLQSCKPAVRWLHVNRGGWVEGGMKAFILPGGHVVGDTDGQQVVFHA